MLSKIISETDPNATVAIVTHGGMVNQLYRAISEGGRVVVKSNMTEHVKEI